jgi:hypothetical protein
MFTPFLGFYGDRSPQVLSVVSRVRGRDIAGERCEAKRRRIPDTTTCTKPLYFGRTIAFMGIGIAALSIGAGKAVEDR